MNRRTKMWMLVAAGLACCMWPGAAQAASLGEWAMAMSPGGAHKGIAWGFHFPTAEDPRTGVGILLINFAVLMFILNKILFKPLRTKHGNNRAAIVEALDKAATATANAESALAEYRGKIDGLEAEVASILQTAQERATQEAAAILEDARAEAEKIKRGAELTIERETAARMRALESEVVDLAMDRAESMLRAKFGPADQQSAVRAYVGEVAGAPLGGQVQ